MSRKPVRPVSPASSLAVSDSRREILIRNRQRARPVDVRRLRRITQTLLQDLWSMEAFDLGVYLVSTPEITRLNEAFLSHQGATDVITFDYLDSAKPGALWGEIFVCVEEAVRQARRFRTSWERELVRYVVHGALHLRGYNDQRPRERREMKRAEDRLLGQLGRRVFGLQVKAG